MDRKQLRTDARAARAAFIDAISPATRSALQLALVDRLMPHLGNPGVLATYAAQGDEFDPAAVESAAVTAGWSLAFPRVARGAPLTFHRAAFADLVPDILGIPAPLPSAPLVAPDALLVPLLAVDVAGNRLGQGGGYYDRTLAQLRRRRTVLAIGLAWDVQCLDALPVEPWDAALDALATPTAFRWFRPPAMARP